MHLIVVALACLAFGSHARRVSLFGANARRSPDSLRSILFATNPARTPPASYASAFARRQAFRMSLPNGGGLPPRGARNQQPAQSSSPFTKLQSYNQEMVNSIEDLRAKRDDWDRQILAEQEEKKRIHEQLSALRNRIQQIDESLEQKAWERDEYQKTISDTEEAYMKIVKDSQDLLQVLKRESVSLSAKKKSSPVEETPPKRAHTPRRETTAQVQEVTIDKVATDKVGENEKQIAHKKKVVANKKNKPDPEKEVDEDELRRLTLKAISDIH